MSVGKGRFVLSDLDEASEEMLGLHLVLLLKKPTQLDLLMQNRCLIFKHICSKRGAFFMKVTS